jgi:hypothetical protein
MATHRARPGASTLFTPPELAHFQLWRHTFFAAEEEAAPYTQLPDAFEYAEYRAWRAGDPPAGAEEMPDSSVATQCGHALHSSGVRPWTSTDAQPAWCPLCTVQIHLELLAGVLSRWRSVGGPWRAVDLASEELHDEYFEMNRAYHRVKLDLVMLLPVLEAGAALEAAWDAGVWPHGARAATDKYHSSLAFPAQLADTAAEPRPKKAAKKTLTYTPATPTDTRHRPPALWTRGMPSYDMSSAHACPDPGGWQDTSYMLDWAYTISQCRILLCYYPSDPSDHTLRYRDLNTGADRGPDNPAVARLVGLIEAELQTKQEWERLQWEKYLHRTGDLWLVSAGEEREEREDFTESEIWPALKGSPVEKWAKEIGEISDEDEEKVVEEEVETEMEETQQEEEGENAELEEGEIVDEELDEGEILD